MDNMFTRFFEDLFARLDGPLHFRLILQPLMAIILATRGGLKDNREGKPPFFWSLFTDPGHRRELLLDAWKSISKVFIIAVLLDVVYQIIVVRWFYPFETVLVAILLALVPYILVRGPVNRIRRDSQNPASPRARN